MAALEQAGLEPGIVPVGGGQFVTFHIDDGLFAVPLTEVQEIIRMPDIVQVPLSPPALEGLANLRGTVMAITSLRRIFDYPDLDHDDTTRVVVLNRGIPAGLVVDRMAAVVSALESEIEPASAIETTISGELLRGVIRQSDNRGMIIILDPRRLTGDHAPGGSKPRDANGDTRNGASHTMLSHNAAGAVDEVQLVSFEVAGQEYALSIEHVQEIVQMPASIAAVPRSDPHVLGIMTLREKLLPLVSLRAMLGLPPASADDRNKIVVVALPSGAAVGIVMDMVREVLRVSRARMEPMPALLNAGGEIAAICRLEDGKRLVSVLSAEALLGTQAVTSALARLSEDVAVAETEENAMTQADTLKGEAVEPEEQFVVFRLADEEYGAPIAAVQEIVRVPESLTRVPKAPAFIKGVVNLRGAVLPVVDQRSRFALPEIARSDRQRIMVFTIGGIRTGFIIDSVSEVLKIPRAAIGPAPELSAEQARLISRVANLEAQKRIIMLIAVDQLLAGEEFGAVAKAAGVVSH
jgi:purine-binding chemotaxis protein CheW